MDNWILGTVFLPVLVGIFKSEIAAFFKAWSIYRSRPFDEDRDPHTPDRCQLWNSATGSWHPILIRRYGFGLKKSKRGVWIEHLLKNGKVAPEKISLGDWSGMRKRKLPKRLTGAL